MWVRTRHRLVRAARELWPGLGSWQLSIVLMVALAFYYLLLAVWSTSSPAQVVRNIAGLLPFLLVYALLMANTAVCLWRRLPLVRRDLSRAPVMIAGHPGWELEVGGEWRLDTVRRCLGGLGLTVVESAGGAICGVRRRGAMLGTFLFHCALFVVALGFGLTILGRREATIWVAEGEAFAAEREQILVQSGPRPPLLRPFVLESVRPEFWQDQLLFTALEARITLDDGSVRVTKINRPLWIGWSSFLRLSGYGYAPRYEIVSQQGQVLESAFVKMNVFPPGQQDSFSLRLFPHRVYLRLYPNYEDRDGAPTTRGFTAANPGLAVEVVRGRLALGSAVITSRGELTFEGLALRFPELRHWGEFKVLTDPGFPVLLTGYLLGVIGLLLRLGGDRGEVLWRPGPDGSGGSLVGFGSVRAPAGSVGR